MKLVKFSVTNFRSITQAYNIPFSDITVLIGKNNEGKSNLLKALNVSMNILDHHSQQKSIRYGMMGYREKENVYKWERDFPISLQNSNKSTTIFRLEFELEGNELNEFKDQIKSNLNGSLPIEIKIGKDLIPIVRVVKRGKGSKTLNQKSKKIAEYIGKKIQFNYIPAIRTDKESLEVIDKMLHKELAVIEDNEKFIEALDTIKALQKPIIEKLSNDIKNSLIEFLPNIKDVVIESYEDRRRFGIRNQFEVFIDDGSKTHIAFKGDGVKSLSALGLLKNMSKSDGVYSLIAIEEPESHLHPGAIHLLKDTIYELGLTNQIIISSHNPLFVNRQKIKSNIIIDCGKATVARSIKNIRDLIGVKASDNLVNANFVLVVEGEEDVIALKSILPFLSEKIARAIKSNFFIIEKVGGASNLSYKLSLLSNALCNYLVLLDNDSAGRVSYQKAIDEKLLKLKDLTLINCIGMPDSEFEDCLNKNIYEASLLEEFGVDINCSQFRSNKKWSDRIKECFNSKGKPWNEKIEAQVKEVVAKSIAKDISNCLNPHKRSSIDSLVNSIESVLDKMK
jgi:predicted ATP-dependent endonuclease of OLD family